MPALTFRNISDATHLALKQRAAQNQRSTEAEVRAIIEAAVRPQERVLMGEAMAAIGRKHGLTNADVDALEAAMDSARDKRPATPLKLK
jgi:plasmid stability protein